MRRKFVLAVLLCMACALILGAAPALGADFPFETLVSTKTPHQAAVAQPTFTFSFNVLHPSAAAKVASGVIVINNARSHRYVTTVPITGVDWTNYTVQNAWIEPPPPPVDFTWTAFNLRNGTYEWHAEVVVNGVTNTWWDEGWLRVWRHIPQS